MSKQEQMELAVEHLDEVEALEAEDPTVSLLSLDESNAGLKSLLGIPDMATEFDRAPMNEAEKDDASRRLNEMIGVRPNSPMINGHTHGPAPENPTAKTLLSLLQSGPKTTEITYSSATHGSPPSHESPHPQFMTQPPPGMHSGFPGPQQFQPPQPPQNRQLQYGGQPFANQLPQMGWQQGPNGMHIQNGFHAPPPGIPNSRFGPPPPMMGGPVQNHMHMMNQAPPFMDQRAHGPPPPRQFTPVNHLPPNQQRNFQPGPPLPSKPQDPNQAGTLLSILKGGPAPPVETLAPHAPKRITPPPNPNAGPPRQQRVENMHPQMQMHYNNQQSPQQWAQNRRPGMPQRSATTLPQPQTFPPPLRPQTAQRGQLSPPPPLRHGTPAVLDHYGGNKTAAPPPPSAQFDRRESVSGERAKTLLAMFKMAPAGAAADEAVVSSPEVEARVPVAATVPPKSPAAKNRAGLLAYLEGVASEGGVSLS